MGEITCTWLLEIDKSTHRDHGPELRPEAQRGFVKLGEETTEFAAIQLDHNPTITPQLLERAILAEFPRARIPKNWAKNCLAAEKKKRLQHIKPSTAALDHFRKEGYWYKYCQKKVPGEEDLFAEEGSDAAENSDSNNQPHTGEITGKVWATEQHKRWLRRFGKRVAIDCTYNTSKTKLPFFQATSKTHTGKIVTLFQVVIDNECEEDFRWVLAQCKQLLRDEGF